MRLTLRYLLACSCLVLLCQLAVADDTRPNFIVMIADDVAWNDLGCTGHPHIRTPNLDRLAKQGMRFDSAFLTCSSCSPSRCSILTGRYPHSTGAAELHQPLPANQETFANLLRQAGYYTASAGKWHLGKPTEKHFDAVLPRGGASGCENWVKVVRERPKDKPFFFWFAAIDAHRGYQANIIEKPHTEKDVVVPPFLPDVPDTRRDLAMYYDEITRLDEYAGKVLAELDEQGIADNTLVIFMSDNGRPFPRCKTTVYDSGVKTPFLVRWPAKVKPGGVCDSLVSSIDIAPTFLELAGVKPSATFQGVSFAPLLTNPTASVREHIFAEHNWHDYQAHKRAARSKEYLYIRNALPKLPGTPPADAVRSPTYRAMIELEKAGKLPPQQRDCFLAPRPREELYDIKNDPFCMNNLIADKTHRKSAQQLRETLDRWIDKTNDKVPDSPTPDGFDRETGQRLKSK